jgi:hypothetical protein
MARIRCTSGSTVGHERVKGPLTSSAGTTSVSTGRTSRDVLVMNTASHCATSRSWGAASFTGTSADGARVNKAGRLPRTRHERRTERGADVQHFGADGPCENAVARRHHRATHDDEDVAAGALQDVAVRVDEEQFVDVG